MTLDYGVCALALAFTFAACDSDAACLASSADADAAVCGTARPFDPGGRCDSLGVSICRMQAEAATGACAVGYATCAGTRGDCVKADRCDDTTDATTCHCGTGPACGDTQVCVATHPGSTPFCACYVAAR